MHVTTSTSSVNSDKKTYNISYWRPCSTDVYISVYLGLFQYWQVIARSQTSNCQILPNGAYKIARGSFEQNRFVTVRLQVIMQRTV